MDDIGRYRILGELGRGGMGIVYRAADPVLAREVAIKTLRLSDLSELSERDSLRERLAREARAAAALSHPGIVAIYDVVQQGDIVGLIMERIEGQTLGQILTTQPPLDLATVFRITREAAAALDYAHRKGIVHRDIKPANLMLDETAMVKIADFGIAKITNSQTRTESAGGLIVGTAGYMAPEQLRGALVDGQADQFSLAVVAYEMLACRRPFMADSLIALTHQVVFEPPPLLSVLRPGLGPAVDAVFETALAKSPADRFPTCSAFAAALEMQVNAAVTPPTLAYPAFVPEQKPPTQYWWTAPIIVLLILAGAAAYIFRRNAAAPPHPISIATTKAPIQQPLPVEPSPDPPPETAPAPRARAKNPAPAAPAVLKAGTIRINKKDSQQYVWVPPGSFTMGCAPGDLTCGPFAKPAHRVTLTKGFWMAQTETTVGAYKAFALATHRDLPRAPNFNANWSLAEHPMVLVSWNDAQAYCARSGGRLPTEAEWEYAARGGDTATAFPWGNDASHDLANFGQGTNAADAKGAIEGKDQWMFTSPVTSFPPGPFHLYDMIGNVSEWCADWYSPNYYAKSPEKDPEGPETGAVRAFRGGSWKSPARFLHISFRGSRAPGDRVLTGGFRCVLNALP